MNKRTFALLISLFLIFTSVLSVCAQENVRVPEEFRGVWVCGRASLDLIRKDGGYIGLIHWGSSYAEHTAWQYQLSYDPESNALVDPGTGVKSTTVFGDNGEEVSYTEEYTDGSARFSINEAGKLIWEDSRENAGLDMEFEKVDLAGLQPSPEELVENWFKTVGGYLDGTAGSSLAKAQAVYNAFDFAQSRRLWDADIPTLRADLLTAWESMSQEERDAFDSNFIDVLRMIDACAVDWDGSKAVFADAGVPVERMEYFLKDVEACASWEVLTSHTLTMGNSDEEVPSGLVVTTQDDGSVVLTVNGDVDEGTEASASITIGEEFPAVDVISELEGDSCLSVTLTNAVTGIDETVLIAAFSSTDHWNVPAGNYNIRFLVKNKATGGTITVRSCDGADGLSADHAALLATDDEFPPFATVYDKDRMEEAVSRAAANSLRDSFSDEKQLVAAVPVEMSGYFDENGGMDFFSWVAVYALRADGETWTAVGYSLAPVRMHLTFRDDMYFDVSDIRWGIDGENWKDDLKDMCAGYEGVAELLINNQPDGEKADEAFQEALRSYMELHDLHFTKFSTYGAEYDL